METGKKNRSSKKVARVEKVSRVFSHAKESLKLLETLSAEKTRQASTNLIRKLRFGQQLTPELVRAEEISTLRTEFAALRDRMDEIELQLASLLGQGRRDRPFNKPTAEPLPRG